MNGVRGESGTTIHHLYVACLKEYIDNSVHASIKERLRQVYPNTELPGENGGEKIPCERS